MGQSIPNPISTYSIIDNDVIEESPKSDSFMTLEEESDLDDYRREIEQEIDEVTSVLLTQGFSYSGKPSTHIDNTPKWQYKIKNLVGQRNLLSYPYVLMTSDDPDSSEHLEIQTPEEFCDLYIEFFTFESEEIYRGTQLKGQLLYLDEEELNEFYDDRIFDPND